MSKFENLLRGGDPRALKGVSRAADDVLHDPARAAELVRAMSHEDAVVRMRAADAAEKVSRSNPECFAPFKAELLSAAATTEQASLRWHFAQLLPRLALTATERRTCVTTFKGYLTDASAIVKTCAMQGLADLARHDIELRRTVRPLIARATQTGTAAMRARGEQLLVELQSKGRR